MGKVWRVRDGILCDYSSMASGGLASGFKAKNDTWHHNVNVNVNAKSAIVAQVENLFNIESSVSVAQVDHIYTPCDEVVQVDHYINC